MDIRINAASPGLIASLVLAVTLAAPGSAGAQQDYPNKPITLVVPFPPGGTSDVVGRIFAEALSREIGQQVIVDNRGGAGGTIGSRYVASAAPDGYTLLLATSSTNGTNSAVYKNLPYDPVKDFTPVTQIIRVPGVIATTKGFPAKDYQSFVALIQASPGKYSYASAGNGSATHMAMEYYKSLTGLQILHVPYRGTGPALNDVIAGQVEMIWDTAASSTQHILCRQSCSHGNCRKVAAGKNAGRTYGRRGRSARLRCRDVERPACAGRFARGHPGQTASGIGKSAPQSGRAKALRCGGRLRHRRPAGGIRRDGAQRRAEVEKSS
mgnify:CR=1 FL=1